MKKRYYVSEGYEEVAFKEFLAVDEDDLIEKVILANTVRVLKEHIGNIEEYRIEGPTSDESMELADAKEYLFLTLNELTADEVYYLFQDGYIHLEELELLEYASFDSITEKEYEIWKKTIKEYLKQSIVAKMKAFGFEASYLDTYTAYRYWDGSNMKEEAVEDEQGFARWYDYTEELEGMKEIDKKRYNTGHDTLYETKDGSKVLIHTSYWQGQGEAIAFLPSDIETVDEAREYIYQQEHDFFGI